MKSKSSRRKCCCCKEFFLPDYRNRERQRYCSKPGCQQASKAAAQRRWLAQSANRNYFRDPENVRRVQRWRKANPGYWKRPGSRSEPGQPTADQRVQPGQASCNGSRDLPRALQDLCITQHPVFVGLISMVTGSTLQEDIDRTARQLLAKGRDILGLANPKTETNPSLPYD